MTAPTISPAVRTGPEGLPQFTLGWEIMGWTAEWLLQPDGPNSGQPWEFTDEQARFIAWWYAIDRNGQFVYRSGMFRRMKGHGKDPLGAALCCVEFVGPCRFSHWENGEPVAKSHTAAWVQTAAVSRDQTRNTMTLFPGMLSPRAIEEFGIDLGKEIIYAEHGRRRIEAVTSSPRALEGGRATFVLKNEVHHWLTSNEGHEMSAVIARNAAKSRDGSSRVLAISNAHDPREDSDGQRDYEAYQKILTGRSRSTGFLYDSLEAPPDCDLSDPVSLRGGLMAARGDSVWLDIDRLMEEIYDPRTPPSMARRFYLNQIIAAEDAWIAPHEWDALARPGRKVEPGEMITLGFDGSKSHDTTALMGCCVSDSHLFPIGIWDPAQHGGEVPTASVDEAVARAHEQFDVVGFYGDVREFESYIDKWERDNLGRRADKQLCVLSSPKHAINFDMRGRTLDVTAAAEAFQTAVLEHDLTHSGDARVSQQIYNAVRRPNRYGINYGKPNQVTPVDAADAAVLARRARQDYLALPEGRRRGHRGIVLWTPKMKKPKGEPIAPTEATPADDA